MVVFNLLITVFEANEVQLCGRTKTPNHTQSRVHGRVIPTQPPTCILTGTPTHAHTQTHMYTHIDTHKHSLEYLQADVVSKTRKYKEHKQATFVRIESH